MRDGLLLLCGADSALDSFGSDTEDTVATLPAGDDEGGELEIALPDELKDEDVADEDDKQKEEKSQDGVIGEDAWCTLSSYGGASSFDETELANVIGPNEDGGLVWTARLVPEGTSIKPRRGMPFPVTTEDFLSSVKRIGTPTIEAQAEAGYDDLWDRDQRSSNIQEEENDVPEA
jgi:hypothetical protein